MKRKILTVLAYTLLVVVVLLLSQCESRVTLTTPKKDAKHIIAMAEAIESEDELKNVEKLARKYEITYRQMMGGAAAREFKRLTEDALREASAVCDDIHAHEAHIAQIQGDFTGKLNELDEAWLRDITNIEQDKEYISKNEQRIKKAQLKIAQLQKEIMAYTDKLIEAGYPADMLEKMSEMEADVKKYEDIIKHIEKDNYTIALAYKVRGQAIVEEKIPEVEPVAEEESTIEEVSDEATSIADESTSDNSEPESESVSKPVVEE